MAEPEEEGFQVVDKRRVAREESQPQAEAEAASVTENEIDAPAAAVDAEPESADEAEDNAGDDPQMGPTNAVDLVQMCLGMLNEIAWVKMGLVPDPMTGQIGADLNQARLAIDCAGDLVHRLETHVDGRTRRDLDVMVQNLKMNFVRRSVDGGS
jgi:hypothetical protein